MRFPGVTCPPLKIDGRKLTGSREIARRSTGSDRSPPLLPGRPGARAAVEEAEAWGEEVAPDRSSPDPLERAEARQAPLASYAEGAKLGVPIGLAVKTAAPIVAAAARINERHRRDRPRRPRGAPGLAPAIDDWIAEGVLGGDQPNAADFQIAACSACDDDGRTCAPAIEARPAGELARGRPRTSRASAPPVLPAAWLEPLRSAQGASASPMHERVQTRVHALARPSAASASREPRPVGQRQFGVELEQRLEDEAPRRHLGVRQRQPLGLQLDVPEQQQVHVERARAVARAAELRPSSTSIALQTSSSSSGSSAVRIRTAAFRKSGWSRISPTGSVSYSDETASTSTPCSESRDRGRAGGRPVADVGAQAEVAARSRRRPRGSSSSSARRARARERPRPRPPRRERERRLGLRGADADAVGAKALHQALADHAGESLERLVAALRRGQGDDVADLGVVDRVLEPVGQYRVAVGDLEARLDLQALADLLLGLGDAMMRVDREPAHSTWTDDSGPSRCASMRRERLPRPRRARRLPSGAAEQYRGARRAPAHLGDVVDAKHLGSARQRQHVGGDRAAEPVADLAAGDLAEEALARGADHDRPAELASSSSRRRSSRLCSRVLPKPIPGSTQIRSSAMPAETATSIRSPRKAFTSSTTSS